MLATYIYLHSGQRQIQRHFRFSPQRTEKVKCKTFSLKENLIKRTVKQNFHLGNWDDDDKLML